MLEALEVRGQGVAEPRGGQELSLVDQVPDRGEAVARADVAVALEGSPDVAGAPLQQRSAPGEAVVVEQAEEEHRRLPGEDAVDERLLLGQGLDPGLHLGAVGVPQVVEGRAPLDPRRGPAGPGIRGSVDGALEGLQEVDDAVGRPQGAVLQDVLAAAEGHVLLRLLPRHAEGSLHRGDVDLVVVEHGKRAPGADDVVGEGHQVGVGGAVEPERQLRLDLVHPPGGLEGQPGEAVGGLRVGSAPPADDHPSVVDRLARRGEDPQRLEEGQGLGPGETPRVQVPGQERAKRHVHAAVVVDCRPPGSRSTSAAAPGGGSRAGTSSRAPAPRPGDRAGPRPGAARRACSRAWSA